MNQILIILNRSKNYWPNLDLKLTNNPIYMRKRRMNIVKRLDFWFKGLSKVAIYNNITSEIRNIDKNVLKKTVF